MILSAINPHFTRDKAQPHKQNIFYFPKIKNHKEKLNQERCHHVPLKEFLIDTKESSSCSSVDNLDTVSTNSSENTIDEKELILNSTLKQKKKIITDDAKYKTEVCRNWSESGQCPYGKKCKFAHGKKELHEKIIFSKSGYKSKKCISFNNKLLCMYGVRCLFTHDQRSTQELLHTNYYNKFITCPELLLEDSVLFKKNRLPVFREKAEESQKLKESRIFENFQDSDEEFSYFLSSFQSQNYFMFWIGSETTNC